MKGFYNRILIIDLTTQDFEARGISDSLIETCLGGKGLASYLLLKNNPPGVDPLSHKNCLIIATGPVTGSLIWGSSRYGLFTKSPQTGLYSESYAGGRVPEAIDAAGYDAVVIKGKSHRLIVLEITPDRVSFHNAEDLKGLSTYETENRVKERFGIPPKGWKSGCIVIGPAGENRVRFSVVENDYWRSAGRTGTGAVMGSKGIKAIVFNGNRKRRVYDPKAIKALARRTAQEGRDSDSAMSYKKFGTPSMVRLTNQAKAFPSRYWSEGTTPHWTNITAEALHEKCQVKPHACLKCFLACGRLSTILQGPHAGLTIEGPEYETIFAFGGLCCVEGIEEIAYLNDICDRLGIDTISAGNLCAFAIEAGLRKRIDLNIEYGDVEGIADLLHKIAFRQGIGEVLAMGVRHAAHVWELEDLAVHVKGLEPPGYDPRVLKGVGLGYAVSDRGACHLRGTFHKAELSGMIDPDVVEEKAALFIDFEDRLTLLDALILCRFYRDLYPWEVLGDIVHGLTGLDADRPFLTRTAGTISDNVRHFNIREGLTRKDDTLPMRFHKEELKTGHVITEKELAYMVDDYYRLRGWDKEGRPLKGSSRTTNPSRS
ncbi:MAG: aldehyde ferredoxin oxidoreductase family protein [Thermodesulfobacteriota bacterium]|nr:aldehyde ferredoxin oxidoreductase family protein [Thermodesulfobacteriota bacterium]